MFSLGAFAQKSDSYDVKNMFRSLWVEIDTDGIKLTKKNLKAFRDLCTQIKKRFLHEKGYYDRGVFEDFGCSVGGRRLNKPKKSPYAHWLIRIAKEDDKLLFDLQLSNKSKGYKFGKSFKYKPADWLPYHHAEIDYKGSILDFSENESFFVTSLYFLNQKLPGNIRYVHESNRDSVELKLSKIEGKQIIEPVARLMLFSIESASISKGYKIEFLGYGILNKDKSSSGEKVVYDLMANEVLMLGKTYFLSSADPWDDSNLLDNLNSLAKSLGKGIGDVLGSALGEIDATLNSAYIGFRYGKQLLQGDPLLESTAFIGILAEIRGGLLEGIKFYHDRLPETVVSEEVVPGQVLDKSLMWNRTTAGYSFYFDMPILIDVIDITPKIGLWEFNGDFPVAQSNGEVIIRNFRVDNEFSFAVEVGGEWRASSYTIRPWFATDQALVTSQFSTTGISSTRFGLDLWYTPKFSFKIMGKNFHPAVLGFGLYESVVLDGQGVAEDEGTFIDGIEYKASYLGLGIAISW